MWIVPKNLHTSHFALDTAALTLDYNALSELCVSRDSLVDELRLLGNGVVPATAERAFRVLWAQLHAP